MFIIYHSGRDHKLSARLLTVTPNFDGNITILQTKWKLKDWKTKVSKENLHTYPTVSNSKSVR